MTKDAEHFSLVIICHSYLLPGRLAVPQLELWLFVCFKINE